MAKHVDQQLREGAVTILTGLPTSADRVYKSRFKAMQAANLPGLRVFTPSADVETATLSGGAARLQERSPMLVVECCAKAAEDVDDIVDEMSKEVETTVANNNSLGGVVKWATLRRTETVIDGEGERAVAVKRLIFECHLYTRMNAPDQPA